MVAVDHGAIPLTKLFVGNLPPYMDHSWLRSLFQYFGKIVQVYVSYKANFWGNKFGFVSFTKRDAALEAIESMNRSRIDNNTIFVDLARPRMNPRPNPVVNRNPIQHWKEKSISRPAVKYSSKPEEWEWLSRSIVGIVRYPKSAEGVARMLMIEVPFRLSLTMISATTMLITFEKEEDCISVIKNGAPWLSECFDNAELWTPTVTCNEKFIRVRVEGVPLHAWNDEFFESICEQWGTLVKIDKETKDRDRLDCCHFIVRVNYLKVIEPEIDVEIDGKVFSLRVIKEDQVYVKPVFLRQSNIPRKSRVEDDDDNFIGGQDKDLSVDTFVPDSQPNEIAKVGVQNSNAIISNPLSLANGNQDDYQNIANNQEILMRGFDSEASNANSPKSIANISPEIMEISDHPRLKETEISTVVEKIQLAKNSVDLNLHDVIISEEEAPIQPILNDSNQSKALRRSNRPSTSKYRKSNFANTSGDIQNLLAAEAVRGMDLRAARKKARKKSIIISSKSRKVKKPTSSSPLHVETASDRDTSTGNDKFSFPPKDLEKDSLLETDDMLQLALQLGLDFNCPWDEAMIESHYLILKEKRQSIT